MSQTMLTTIDNQFNPFTEFDEWKAFDEAQGYFTCQLLARLAFTSDSLTPEENDTAIDLAINEIIEQNILGIYKKVYKKES